ncbi:MAG: transcription antitermination factor NusB [Proteobacteria bacterium]|nr:MAG: transcription antitermination factor NusB [Pseudomonadota bacterium]
MTTTTTTTTTRPPGSAAPRVVVRGEGRVTDVGSRQGAGHAGQERAAPRARFEKADAGHFEALLHGAIRAADELDELIAPNLDRKVAELSPVEHGVLMLAAFELSRMPEIPYRVVINEAVELAKTYGGTDGYKYVNGVLDRVAARLRPHEAALRG